MMSQRWLTAGLKRGPWPSVRERMGTGPLGSLFSKSTEIRVQAQVLLCAARHIVSRCQAVGGLRSHDSYLHSHPYRRGRPVAGLPDCSRARPWLVLAWLPPRLPGSEGPLGSCTSQKKVIGPVSVGIPISYTPLPVLVSYPSSCW